MQPDVDKIRMLSARDVADRLGLLDGSSQGDRFRFASHDGSHWIQFYDNGKWLNHKSDYGGDCISLVQAHIAGGPDYHPHSHDAGFPEALHQIATAFSLWRTLDGARAKSKQLARGSQRSRDKYAHVQDMAGQFMAMDDDKRAAAHDLLSALGVDPARITLCPDGAGTGALCWQPAVPWQGVGMSRRADNKLGGWTKERALKFAGDEAALRVVCIDLDGDTATGRRPRWALIERICQDMGRRGMPVAGLVWSSFGDDAERAKAHLYFVASDAARTVSQWESWWGLVAGAINTIVAGWGEVSGEERELLKIDPGTQQITRLVRLPGYAKHESAWAGVVERVDAQARVDFDAIAETQDLCWTWGTTTKRTSACIGARCTLRTEDQSGENPQIMTYVLARDVWVLAKYHTQARDDAGAYLRIVTHDGMVRYVTIPASSFADKSRRTAAAAHLNSLGAQIMQDRGEQLVSVIGRAYSERGRLGRQGLLTRTAGWQGEAYVLGREVLGAGTIEVLPDSSSEMLRRRGSQAGGLEGWQEHVVAQCTTPGLRLALGASLAGAMMRKLRRHPFVLHVAGPSSVGKSTAAHVAASVWGEPSASGVYQSWDTTSRALEGLAELAQDACLVLDEVGRWRGSPEDLAGALHALGGSEGRARLRQDGSLSAQRTWHCTTVSTGEVRLMDLLGDHMQGGHAVRALDLWLAPGEASTSAAHAESIKRGCARHHGHAARVFVDALIGADWDELEARVQRVVEALCTTIPDASGEVRRQAGSIAVCIVALGVAQSCGLVPWGGEERQELAEWALRSIVTARVQEMAHSPEHRMLRALMGVMDEAEARAPWIQGNGLSTTPKGLIAIREASTGVAHTCSQWLKRSGLPAQAGVDAREWLRWARKNGLIQEDPYQRRLGGFRKSFWALNMDAAELMAEGPSVNMRPGDES